MATVKWILVGPGRCGSNWLVSALRFNPQIRAYGEVFNCPGAWDGSASSLAGKRPPAVDEPGGCYLADEVYGKWAPGVPAVGCKIFYQHPKGAHQQVWGWASRERIKVLCLRRRNWLNWYLSLKMALREQRWLGHTQKEAAYQQHSISVDPDEVILRIRRMQSLEARVLRKLSGCSMLTLHYEDLEESFGFWALLAQAHLGVAPMSVAGETFRQRCWSQREAVKNWSDLHKIFLKHPDMAGYLEDS